MKSNELINKFVVFHKKNPHIYREIVRRAKQFRQIQPGGKIGIALIYNLMRWDNAISTTGDVFKLRNDFQPLYARLVMKKNPELKGVFDTRRMFSNGVK